MSEHQPPAPLVREFRYNPHQPRDAKGRWTGGDSTRAAEEANANRREHEDRTPAPGQPGRGSHLRALKGHLRLIAAHAAHAAGHDAAARAHLAKADAHFKAAGEHHGLTERIKGDMASLRGELKTRAHAAGLEDADLHEYRRYVPDQPRDHGGRWAEGGADAEAHREGAAHHASRREEARAVGNHQHAARHHATQLAHEAAIHIHNGDQGHAEATLDRLRKANLALHVQMRYARNHNLGADEVARRDHVTKHYQGLQSRLRQSIKTGAVPAVTHYQAPAAA